MSKVLILGGTGMLGHTLFRYLSKDSELNVFTTVRSPKKLSDWLPAERMRNVLGDVDVQQTDSLMKVFANLKPEIVINCIGIIKQLPEAADPLATISLNALLPHRIACLCSAVGARMIHISTDCVFAGEKGSYEEDDFSDATDLYGKTKFLGEVTYAHCTTLRTSIIGHELNSSYGLVEWFLNQKQKVRGFRKVIYSGLPTVELSQVIHDYVIPNPKMTGLYHISSNSISKYELLKLIAAQYDKKIEIEPDDSIQLDRSLNSVKFRTLTGYNPPTWSELVHKMYQDYEQGQYQLG